MKWLAALVVLGLLAAGPVAVDAADKRGKDDEKVWKSDDLNLLAVGMSIGDVTGSGRNDIVVIDPNTVYLYKVDGKRLELLSEFQRSAMEFKSVDVAKIRKQGPCRIYVTAQMRGSLASFVLEYRNGALTPAIENIPYYLRVITYPTKGPILLCQSRGLNKIYDGPVHTMEDKGDELKPGPRFGTPMKIPIFGFAIGDFEGKRRPMIAVYDRDDHLRIYEPSGKRLFVSRSFYGGSDVVLRRTGPESRKESDPTQEEAAKEYYRPRLLSLDLNHSGTYQIVAIANESKTMRFLTRTKMLGEGQIKGLIWNGDALEERWATPKVQGTVTDFAVETLPGFASPRLITLERKQTDWLAFLKSISQIRAYDLRSLMERGVQPEGEP
jgi:hypothetical protein